jgi:hypothetical protein
MRGIHCDEIGHGRCGVGVIGFCGLSAVLRLMNALAENLKKKPNNRDRAERCRKGGVETNLII